MLSVAACQPYDCDEQGHFGKRTEHLFVGAMQITALGNPKLLERVAAGLMAIRNMFSQFDEDMNNVITREEFIKVTSIACAAPPN